MAKSTYCTNELCTYCSYSLMLPVPYPDDKLISLHWLHGLCMATIACQKHLYSIPLYTSIHMYVTACSLPQASVLYLWLELRQSQFWISWGLEPKAPGPAHLLFALDRIEAFFTNICNDGSP